MNDRWLRVESICQSALDRPQAERAAFVADACGGDAALQREVEDLLARESAASGFLSGPAGRAAAQAFTRAVDSMVGRQIGAYAVTSRLGTGGMGEVYRAHDRALGRDVAIKVLPSELASNPERMARFEREARILASLNHPSIATIHGVEAFDGRRAIVLELIDGETLADRIARGPMAWRDTAQIARQIADALEAAHDKGIVHRDLKPANIKITPAGLVKVLDFGLAKVPVAGAAADHEMSRLTVGETQQGAIVGTPAYMSPEQARGQAVDKRTDIWAFGCLLYEMLTGRRVFGGSTLSDHIAAILEREPDWTALPCETPAAIRRVVSRCLTKDLHCRLHDIADARIELDDGLVGRGADEDPSTPAATPRRRLVAVALMAAIGGALATWLIATSLYRGNGAGPAYATRSTVVAPQQTYLTETIGPSIAISRDGSMVAFAAVTGERSRLFLRRIDSLDATPIAGTDGGIELTSLAHVPEFSPDGRWLVYGADGLLKKIAVSGGAVQTLGAAPGLKSVMWTDDGQLLISDILQKGLTMMPAAGGTPTQITTQGPDELWHRGGVLLPGGRALLMTVFTDDMRTWDDARIESVVLGTGERKILVRGGVQPRYLPTGHLLYARAGRLIAVPFDADRLEVHGTPTVVMDGVNTDTVWGYANFAVSANGSLVYMPGGANVRPASLIWVDRAGRAGEVTDLDRLAVQVRISPDGNRAAIGIDTGSSEIWALDIRRSMLTKLVSGRNASQPIWLTDGGRIMFGSSRGLRVQAVDGSSGSEASDVDAPGYPNEWSPGDRLLLLTDVPGRGLKYWSRETRQTREVPNASRGRGSRLSPDGAWVAFQSDETGRDEVYVQTFPGGLARWRVSAQGGRFPVWSRDGHELFFVEGDAMMVASVTRTSGKLQTSTPVRLFDVKELLVTESSYDTAPDGRFLMIKNEPHTATQLNLVQNWFSELRVRDR